MSAKYCEGMTPLHWAVEHRNEAMVKMLLDSNPGASSIQDEFGRTPLHQAAETGDTQMMALLLKACTNINLKNNNGQTPLHIAMTFGECSVVKMLRVAKGITRRQ